MADLSPSAFALYLFYIWQSNESQIVTVSQKTAAEKTGISYSHLSRAKSELEEKGWIEVTKRSVRLILGYDKVAKNANIENGKIAKNANFEIESCEKRKLLIKKNVPFNNIYNYIYNNNNINNKYNKFNNNIISEVEKKMTKKGTRLPDDFSVTEEMLRWAVEKRLSVDLEIETEKFLNYWMSVPGAKGVKLDWVATWRNWMLNAEGYQRGRGNGGYQKAPSTNREKLSSYGSVFAKYEADPEE